MFDAVLQIIIGFIGAAIVSLYGIFFMIWIYFIFAAFIFGLGMLVLWIISLIDCIRRKDEDFAIGGTNAKLIWLLLLILVRNIVPLIYFILIIYKKPAAVNKK